MIQILGQDGNQLKPDKKFDYQYPNGYDLSPQSVLHNRLVTRIRQMGQNSYSAISKRFSRWNDTDRVLTSYVELDNEEREIVAGDDRKPVSIIYPYTLAIMETMLAYLNAALLNGVVFRFSGVGPEDTLGAILLQKVIDHHVYRSRVKLNLHTLMRDSLCYGIGAAVPGWLIKEGDVFQTDQFGQRSSYEGIVYEGNSLLNIDPYLILPDPQVPIHEVQRAEYFGWIEQTSFQRKLREEKNEPGVFNVKYLRNLPFQYSSFMNDNPKIRDWSKGGSWKDDYSGGRTQYNHDVLDVNFYIDLIPNEWGLGSSEYPEKWWITLSQDQVITRMVPLTLPHGDFPVIIAAPNTDGYASTPLSHVETLSGLQKILDFLLNAHVKATRKNVNNIYIVDPQSINMKDMEQVSERGGGFVRLRRPAFGKGVKDYVEQLPVNDVTRQNIGDANYILEGMQKISGADDAAMGSLRMGGPERLTGKEFQGTQKALYTRLERTAFMLGAQALQPLGEMFACHVQKYMTQETFVDLTGEWKELLERIHGTGGPHGRLKVSPLDLRVNYDVRVSDGSIPDASSSGFWLQTFEILSQHPELQQRYDIDRIFKKIAVNAGEKNVEDFIKTQPVQAQAMPDEQVMEMAQSGQAVPSMGEGGYFGS